MKKVWRCTVCGYLHEGDTPPPFCPVCHADASKFVLVGEEPDEPVAAPTPSGLSGMLREILDVFVPHAVAAHFPNALIPTMVLFLFAFLISGHASFDLAAFYLLLVVVLTVPITFATGLYDWKTLYGGASAPIFRRKIILASVLSILAAGTAVWRWQTPELLEAGGWPLVIFLLLVAVMLGCVALLGHYGGMLVFGQKRKNS